MTQLDSLHASSRLEIVDPELGARLLVGVGAAAVQAGRFGAEIGPYVIKTRKGEITVDTDDHIRPDTSLEALSQLRAAFGKDGTVTAGNASGIVDGAAAVLVTTGERAQADGIPPHQAANKVAETRIQEARHLQRTFRA